jgi:hypothetical protein
MADQKISASQLTSADVSELLPVEIEHKCDEIRDGDRLLQSYNYFVYHFECAGLYYWARSYLDDIKNVALYGPFDGRQTKKLVEGNVTQPDLLSYLQRRYRSISVLSENGYTLIWQR